MISAAVTRLFCERKKKAEVEKTPFQKPSERESLGFFFALFLPHHRKRLSTIEQKPTVIQGLNFTHAPCMRLRVAIRDPVLLRKLEKN